MSTPLSARGEMLSLLRNFLRLRYKFPSKQGRSALRRRILNSFSMRQANFLYLADTQGLQVAQHHAREWRTNAWKDLELWRQVAGASEKKRRKLLKEMTSDKLY